jgi:hypothetical protein
VEQRTVEQSALALDHELRTQLALYMAERTGFAARTEPHFVVQALLSFPDFMTELAVLHPTEPLQTLIAALRNPVRIEFVQKVAETPSSALAFEEELADGLTVRTAVLERTVFAFATALLKEVSPAQPTVPELRFTFVSPRETGGVCNPFNIHYKQISQQVITSLHLRA